MSTRWITLRSIDPDVSVRCLHGEGRAVLSGGVGGTVTLDVPHDTQAVHWETHPPYQLSVPLVLDGWATQTSVADDLHNIYKMARVEPGGRRPPSVYVTEGAVPRKDLAWLVEDVVLGEALVRESDGVLLRQHVRLELVQDRRVTVGQSRAQSAAERARNRAQARTLQQQSTALRQARGKPYTVRAGDTLPRIAAAKHVEGGWRAIARLNGIRDPRSIKVGQRIRIPS